MESPNNSIQNKNSCQSGVCDLPDISHNAKQPDVEFWSNDPNILFHKDYIFEFFPVENMTYEQKMNAISRLIILLTIIGFAISRNIRLLIISLVTLGTIYLLYRTNQKEKFSDSYKTGYEGFGGGNRQLAIDTLKQNEILDVEKTNRLGELFDTPTSSNPMSNVLMSDYDYNVDKKPAPQSFNPQTSSNILEQAKRLVSELNPDQPDISNKLFKDLNDEMEFEQSMRQFYTNPGTTIPNDQKAFAEFCYGSMISCKEGNMFACARNMARHTDGSG
jgi:hypothetical protein